VDLFNLDMIRQWKPFWRNDNNKRHKWLSRVGVPILFCAVFFGIQTWIILGEQYNTEPVTIAYNNSIGHSAYALADNSKSIISPQVLYERAWRLVKENYYDQKFNSEDWNYWEHHYDNKLKTMDDSHKAIETMLASLGDPYTRFLDRDAFDEEKSQIDAHLYGVGMLLGMNKEHKVVVIAPIEGTPASNAGIHPGDEITEVDNKPVKGQSLDQVVKQIRGPINTKVTIGFLRKLEKHKAILSRAEIPIKAVYNTEILPGNIGYIRLDSFISSKANQEMKEALKKVASADGLVFDLRNNPGGLLSNATDIANMFLDGKVIVSTIDADGYKNSTYSSHNPIYRKPMVVLINHYSASASEILSGALRDNGRAKLVGQTSFGKGLVQAINKLEDNSGINITIARYLTPNDIDIHKVGIVPDYKITLKDEDYDKGRGPWWVDPTYSTFKHSPTDGKDLQLNKAEDVLKTEIAKVNTGSQDNKTASAAHSETTVQQN
jgi:carboxyl-terminal processing protease